MKTCSKCNNEKELCGFSNSNIRDDGLRNDCKQCEQKLKSSLWVKAKIKNIPVVKTNKKVCPVCTLEKSKKEFSIRRSNKDGFSTICKVCFQHHNDVEKIKANTLHKILHVKNLKKLEKDIPDNLIEFELLNPEDYKHLSLKVPKKDHGEGSKVCPICSAEKNFSEYTIQSSRKDGLAPNCRVCVNTHNKVEQEKAHMYVNIRHVKKLEQEGKPIRENLLRFVGLTLEDYAFVKIRPYEN
jgi:hypothetical protein